MDRTYHLMRRLETGELPKVSPKIVVLYVANNDLGYWWEQGEARLLQEVDPLVSRWVGWVGCGQVGWVGRW